MFYGMSSELAMQKHYGTMAKYRSSEGRVVKVKYKGPLENTILDPNDSVGRFIFLSNWHLI